MTVFRVGIVLEIPWTVIGYLEASLTHREFSTTWDLSRTKHQAYTS